MTSSIRTIIRALRAPEHLLACSARLWAEGVAELARRGRGCRESGAFLLGTRTGDRRRIERFVFYDDLDPHALDSGIVTFDSAGYDPLWRICREEGLQVVADVHTHPGRARMSTLDRNHPMIGQAGHLALILPNFALRPFSRRDMPEIGIYEYLGDHQWRDFSGHATRTRFYIGFWG